VLSVKARTVAGVSICVLGLILLLVAGLDFNNLFFVQKLLTKSDVPTYNQNVVLPGLLGFLVLIDGSIVLGLKRIFSLSLHVLGNFVWLFALSTMHQELAVPITDISAYQQAFYLVFLGTIFFVVGIIVNDIPRRATSP